tara:strand:+ start:724 stop:954 length:231 start_codon:yes stop_codon:yes gene_type:complete
MLNNTLGGNMTRTINLNDYLANLSDNKLNQIYQTMINAESPNQLNIKEEIAYISLDLVFNELDKRGLAVYSDELED